MIAAGDGAAEVRREDRAAARENRIWTVGFLLNLAVGLVALTTGVIFDITTNSEAERAEWREAVISSVVVWDLVAIANVTAMYWYPTWRRHRRGCRPQILQDGRVTWVHGQVVALSLVLCYVMLFREQGTPGWLLVLTIVTAANAVAAYVHDELAIRRIVKNAPRL